MPSMARKQKLASVAAKRENSWAKQAAELCALATKKIGAPIRPHDVADMSLSNAAYWIAAEGGSRKFKINEVEVWKAAFAALLKIVVDGKAVVLGRKRGDGLPEPVPSAHFSNIRIAYPYLDVPHSLFGPDHYLECHGVVDETYWRNGFDDKLFSSGRQLQWSHLRISGASVASLWPFKTKTKSGAKMKYDWPDVREFVLKTMGERKEFNEWDEVGWKCQADLERLVIDYMEPSPSSSSVKKYVAKYLEEWRSQPANPAS